MSSSAFRRLSKELVQLQNSPPEGIRVVLDENDMLNVVGWIEGPQGTPFEGGYYKIRFQFGSDFPNQPPKCWFATKIFHPNVAPSTGEICVSTLKKDWKKEYGVGHILITVKCLLIHPNPESALHEEAGKLLLEAYDDYARHARLMTDVHARHRPTEFTTTASSTSYSPYPAAASGPSASTSTSGSAGPSTLAASRTASAPTAHAGGSITHASRDENMHDAAPLPLAVSEAMKPSLSGSTSSTSSSNINVVPKKRPAPVSSTSTSASSSSGAFAPAGAYPQGVLGASSVLGNSNGNALPAKKAAVAGSAGAGTGAAQKKRGLKRL